MTEMSVIQRLNKIVDTELQELKQLHKKKWNSCGYTLDDNGRVNEIFLPHINITHLKPIVSELIHLKALKKLDLGSNYKLEDISSIKSLQHIVNLDLSFCSIVDLSPLQNLIQLDFLDISNNKIKDISAMRELEQISHLSISGNEISDISALQVFKNLTHLSIGNIRGNDLLFLKKFTSLKFLDINNTEVSNISFLQELKELEDVNLSDNQITDFSTLKKIKNLKSLNLSGNNFRNFYLLEELSQLKSLSLHGNKMIDISWVKKLQHLTHLDLTNNEISNISPLQELQELSYLNLSNNLITDINPLSKLEKLDVLWLMGNKIEDVSAIENLKNLQQVSLGNNQIKKLFSFSKITNLQRLDLYQNSLSDISSLSDLKTITELKLENNNIEDLLPLSNLNLLEKLNLRNNKIKDITALRNLNLLLNLQLQTNPISEVPSWITDYNMRIKWDSNGYDDGYLTFYDNPIVNPPIEILKQGVEAIKNYFDQIKEDKDYLYEAKLLLVGEERSGKSTIAMALTNPNFKIDLQRDHSTQGIDILRWIIPSFKIETLKDFCFNIWDFGGQVIYHSTHQFFLTKRSLYLFITEARKDLRFDDFYYWLNIINTLAGDSPVILVQNKTDQDHKNQSIEEYRTMFPQIAAGIQTISCNTEHVDWELIYKPRLEILKENIYKILKEKKLEGVGDELPKAWVDIRREINKLQTEDINFISQSYYFEICGKYGLNEEQAIFLSDYFHDLGVFLHFRNDLQLRDTIFIDHQWVTKAIYNVFDNKRVKDEHGKFTDKDLMLIWQEEEFAGKQAQLLNLMKNPQFKICYQHENRYYLAPQLFEDKPVEYEWRTNENNLNFRYQYEFMPKGILSQLIVIMHKHIYQDTFWLYGVLFEYKNSRAIVKENRFGKKNLISIQVEGDSKKDLLTLIISNIEKINDSYTNLKITEMFGCNCSECLALENPYFYKMELINRAIQKQKQSVECQISFENVIISSLLDKYMKSDKIDKHIHYSDVESEFTPDRILTKKPNKKKTIRIFLASSSELVNDRKEIREFISVENDRLNDEGIYLKIIQWEYFIDSISEAGKQDDYNKEVIACDIFLSLFFTKVGKFSNEEFEKAYGQFIKINKPKVYTYFKHTDIDISKLNREDFNSKVDFEEKLKSMGHFPSVYNTMSDLKYQFKLQLEKIIPAILENN